MAQALLATLAIVLALITPAFSADIADVQAPAWAGLNNSQRQTLAPLAEQWDTLDQTRRKKWLAIAQRYPSMSDDEKQRLQRRMKSWAALTPAQRARARAQYKNLQGISPQKREALKEQWQEYENLPEDEKRRLSAQSGAAAPKKPISGKPLVPSAKTSTRHRSLATPPEAANPPAGTP